ncbi:MAG: serine/threonine-protein kinase [Polyangiaceae bacterium]
MLHEARAQARLRHPNVCEVHEAGIADGVPFIVMRYIEGAAFSEAAGEMSVEQRVAAVRDVALALHEAHRVGLIHRDIKPGNILVERGEDGALTPYVADFGIACDVTLGDGAGADRVQGTPAFMSPEQAAGKVRAMDRRSDVYSLGATLFSALSGRPPFAGASVTGVLKSVIEGEPPALRSLAPEIPPELSAIVMRCLEKDPAARYDSARALAEDCQRFLDGDPVLAARPSLAERLWKKARKNKGKVLAAALAIGVGLSLGGLWMRERAIATEREALARELGGSVREMEMFLRQAYTLPLHDTGREQEVVRARLREIEERMAEAGEVARGPGNDALGRGYLALQDAPSALLHLEIARATGHVAPGLEYALGLARIGLYREGLEKANRLQKDSEKEAFIASIEKEHRDPALAHLRAALGQGLESPAYARGLVALYEGRLEEALAQAREAFAAAPWLYEAKKLEGDVHAAMGGRAGHDRVFDNERATKAFERAAEAYAAAAAIARSDPAVHEAECDLWIGFMHAAAEHGDPMRPSFERAKGACERAIAASPGRASGHLKLALAHSSFSFWVATGHHADETPDEALSRAAERVEEAARWSPDNAFARYLTGDVWRTRAIYDVERGVDEGPAIDRSVAGYESALAIEPTHLWALNEGCSVLAMRGQREARLGRDPAGSFETALEHCGRAVELDPDFMYPRGTTIVVHIDDAERLVARGVSPREAIERGLLAAKSFEAKNPTWKWLPYWRAMLYRIQAEHDLASGGDPGPSLSRAEEQLARSHEKIPEIDAETGEVATVRAEAILARDPLDTAELSAAVASARAAFERARKETPWDSEYAVWLSRVERIELLGQLAAGGRPPADRAGAVLAPLSPFLTESGSAPRLLVAAALAYEARAALAERLGGDEGAEIAACIQMAERAVKAGPGVARAHAVLGRCRLSAARLGKGDERGRLAGLAAAALREAVRLDPLLAGALAPWMAEAARLSGGVGEGLSEAR